MQGQMLLLCPIGVRCRVRSCWCDQYERGAGSDVAGVTNRSNEQGQVHLRIRPRVRCGDLVVSAPSLPLDPPLLGSNLGLAGPLGLRGDRSLCEYCTNKVRKHQAQVGCRLKNK